MAIKYFFYSSEQMKFRKAIEEKMGKKFRTGHVIVDGVKKQFTEMTSNPTSRYADAKLVAEGDPMQLKYVLPEGR